VLCTKRGGSSGDGGCGNGGGNGGICIKLESIMICFYKFDICKQN